LATADPDEQTAEAVRLVVVEGQDYKSAAEAIGVSVRTLNRRLASPAGRGLLDDARAAIGAVALLRTQSAALGVALPALVEIAGDDTMEPKERIAAAKALLASALDPKRQDSAALVGAAAQGGAMGAAAGAAAGATLAKWVEEMRGPDGTRSFGDVLDVDLMDASETPPPEKPGRGSD